MQSGDSTISKIAIGTVQFGLDYGISNHEGRTSQVEVEGILELAKANGVSTLDTAFAYGESETVLGENDLSGFMIVSKFLAETTKSLGNALELSLNRLKLDSLYGYMAHRAEDLLEFPILIDELKALKSEGRVSKIGCSLYHPETLVQLWEAGFHPEIVQIPFNVFDQRFAAHLTRLQDSGCEIHVRSVFLQGIFFTEPEKLGRFFDPMKSSIREIQNAFPDPADRAAQLIRFCLSNSEIDRVVIGINSQEQLAENLKALLSNRASQLEPVKLNEELIMPHLWPKRN